MEKVVGGKENDDRKAVGMEDVRRVNPYTPKEIFNGYSLR